MILLLPTANWEPFGLFQGTETISTDGRDGLTLLRSATVGIDLDKHCRAKVSERNKKKVPAPRCDGTKRALQSLLSPVLGHLLMIWSRCSGLL